FFVLDWTFGRIWFIKPIPDGASFTAQPELFLQAIGDNGFAPTAAAVDPRTGELVVSVGGRGTRGAVYRIRYEGNETFEAPPDGSPRAVPQTAADLLRWAETGRPEERLLALQTLRRNASACSPEQIGRAILPNAGHADRYVRLAAADLVQALPSEQQTRLFDAATDDLARATLLLAGCFEEPDRRFQAAARILTGAQATPETRLTCLRVMQEALGGLTSPDAAGTVWEGYTPRRRLSQGLPCNWFRLFPCGHRDVDWELARTLALLQPEEPGFLKPLAQKLTTASEPEADIHYLIVISRLRGERTPDVTRAVAEALLALDRKLDARQANRDRNWPLRIAELHVRLAEKDPALNQALIEHPEFGRPDHVLFTQAPGFDRKHAARLLWEKARKDSDYPWLPGLVKLVGELDEEAVVESLRRLWEQAVLRDAILPVVVKHLSDQDRPLLRDALESSNSESIRLACEALTRLCLERDGETALRVLRCWRSLSDSQEERRLRPHFRAVLSRVAQQDHGSELKPWLDWFSRTFPGLVRQLEEMESASLEKWQGRLEKIDWSVGDARQGKRVFQRLGCASCHAGGQAVGPDLRGVVSRFSRDDLFTAIVAPNRDVSPRYQTSIILTADGRTYRGTVIYEAADGLILQTGPDATVRISADQISARRPSRLSLMPAGLLDRCSDQEIVDLFHYLKTLASP
ncbi:MAG: c-type cytochrome, partial [Gemmatales bacterium]|nr:c-type cytochrome [Gemmatales bacterium]MDW8386388.1 c-type cytochrome [Gemmatales bacterium]